MKQVMVWFIRIYQKTLSPDHGPLAFLHPFGVCRYHPTCSEYGVLAIRKYGVVHGGWKTCKRVGRCHPLSDGGVDEP